MVEVVGILRLLVDEVKGVIGWKVVDEAEWMLVGGVVWMLVHGVVWKVVVDELAWEAADEVVTKSADEAGWKAANEVVRATANEIVTKTAAAASRGLKASDEFANSKPADGATADFSTAPTNSKSYTGFQAHYQAT